MAAERYELDLDTAPLRPEQLSDHEKTIASEIEDRLRVVEKLAAPEKANEQFKPDCEAPAEDRWQRVLLIDGDRGTGKTSFLVTLIDRWKRAARKDHSEEWPAVPKAPEYVTVLRNLDFDPLPPRMPVLAAIVQAWRPLVERYDDESFGREDPCDDLGGNRLMDSWHVLFQVAATGWSELPMSKGLIEQVLDRAEQVKDWQQLRENWLWFVQRVIDTGRCLKSKHKLPDHPAFVIIIDDVDLQVERVRELLPALRMLSHPNVFFLVAAHQKHLIEMLKLDYFGQQQRVAFSRSENLDAGKQDPWAGKLAHAAFEKVFPIRNRWHLELLSLDDVLKYPPTSPGRNGRTLGSVLKAVRRQPDIRNDTSDNKKDPNAQAAITRLAKAARAVSVHLPAISYRSAQQLWQKVDGSRSPSKKDAATVLARIVSADPLEPAEVLGADDPSIFVENAGGVAATYQMTQLDPGGQENVVVSARPDFRYESPDGAIRRISGPELTARLLASTLQELNFPLLTASAWEARLTFAWTEWPRFDAVFAWPWHTQPRPDELLEQTKWWSDYLISKGPVEKLRIRERYAYAWVYFERKRYFQRWSNIKDGEEPPDPSSLTEPTEPTKLHWDTLLKFAKDESVDNSEHKGWGERTLPLLARPEIGLDLNAQEILLRHSRLTPAIRANLCEQRRRLATEALLAALLKRNQKRVQPAQEDVDTMLEGIEAHHIETRGKRSKWSEQVGPVRRTDNESE